MSKTEMNSEASLDLPFCEPAQDDILSSPFWYRNRTSNEYNHIQLCNLLTKDSTMRSLCYKVIDNNKHLFKDKVVLDLECGTGLVSMFLSSCEAKMVIAIEENKTLADITRKVIYKNNVKNVIILQGDVDDIAHLPELIENVDIIVCQWMWHLFFDEKLLTKLIRARDRWLKPNGLMFPDAIKLWITAARNIKTKKQYTQIANKAHSFDLSSLCDSLKQIPNCESISSDTVQTNCVELHCIDLATVTLSEVAFSKPFELVAQSACDIHSFVMFFDAIFSRCHKTVVISNSPFDSPPTMWRQITLSFDGRIQMKPDEKIRAEFHFSLHQPLNSGFNMCLKIYFFGELSSCTGRNYYNL